ncbi:MAG TPA: capsule assembly Wzi family protein [Longimicrobium sp.]|nr:capsule assembly Wzi family protein [Longimicrobium sp.]
MTRRPLPALLALALLAAPVRLSGQGGGVPSDSGAPALPPSPFATAPAPSLVRALPTVGGADEEAARVAQLRGEAYGDGFLLRSPSSMSPEGGARIAVLAPEVLLAWNSRLPSSFLDGALWAGKGAGALVMAGVDVQVGPVRLIAAPELVYSANTQFDTLLPPEWRGTDPPTYYPDWQRNEHSIDLPFRMGGDALSGVGAGQSSLTVRAGAVAFGAATENQWWGPAIRSALVLSNQAPGFGHLFLRTARPLRTPVGRVEARWVAGALRDSRFYAPAHGGGERGWRTFSGAAVVVAPSSGLSLGVARTVYAPADGAMDALAGGALVFTRWDQIGAIYPDPSEQITSFFGRLLMPRAGMEVYAEWARTRLPINFRDLLEVPEHSQGFTLGLQWLRPAGSGDLRLQAEHTYLEESPTYAWRQNGSWYASDQVPQGYTNDGQVLGSPVGPGGSGQWLAVDWLRGRGRAGVYLQRVRWDQDAYYDQPGGFNRYLAYDVSLFGGARAAWAVGGVRLDAEYALEHRWNIFYQNDALEFTQRKLGIRARNHTLRLRFTAAAPRLGRLY